MIDKQACLAMDSQDPLRALREQFVLNENEIYLDGNSLGALPRSTAARVRHTVEQEWGIGQIRSWNTAHWIDMPQRVGDKIAQLLGAAPGEVVAADSTSVNLYKALSVAASMMHEQAPHRRRIVSERSNFPSDLYIAQSVAQRYGMELLLVDEHEIAAHLNEQLAILMLSHVNYQTGHMHDMSAMTHAAHNAGAIVLWDLAHSAGAVPVDLHGADADFAVGCGYKYLNGGPGAPAFIWVHPRHVDRYQQPLSGWLGHASSFDLTPDYQPAQGISRYLCGTPAIIGMAALECGVDTVLAAAPLGGLHALREKSLALSTLFIALVEERCAGHGLKLVTPREPALRGSQVCLARDEGAYAITQALIARGVIGDFRAPDILRLGFTPLYTRYIDVWNAVEHLSAVLDTQEWREARFHERSIVT